MREDIVDITSPTKKTEDKTSLDDTLKENPTPLHESTLQEYLMEKFLTESPTRYLKTNDSTDAEGTAGEGNEDLLFDMDSNSVHCNHEEQSYEEHSHEEHSHEEHSHEEHSYEEHSHEEHSYEEHSHEEHSYEETDDANNFQERAL